jgi:IclR family acetate operon transcriptional repressor
MLALDSIRQSAEPLSLMEISGVLGLTKASAFRLVHTLESLGYLAKSADGRYFAPPKSNLHELVRLGSDVLERLGMEFCETVSMAALFENHLEVLAVFESSQLIRMSNTPGRILPPNASSLGKAITAFQPPAITEKLVRSYGTHSFTPNTIVDEIALRDEFARVRAKGFAEDIEESVMGGRCFAAPVLRQSGHAVGAISLSMPLVRYRGEDQRRQILTAIREAALAIEKRIACQVLDRHPVL